MTEGYTVPPNVWTQIPGCSLEVYSYHETSIVVFVFDDGTLGLSPSASRLHPLSVLMIRTALRPA